MYMRNVDKFNNQLYVSCMQTPSGARFLILHENNKNEEQIKQFFNEVYEIFVKIVMNPFFDTSEKISIPQFDEKVRMIAHRTFWLFIVFIKFKIIINLLFLFKLKQIYNHFIWHYLLQIISSIFQY